MWPLSPESPLKLSTAGLITVWNKMRGEELGQRQTMVVGWIMWLQIQLHITNTNTNENTKFIKIWNKKRGEEWGPRQTMVVGWIMWLHIHVLSFPICDAAKPETDQQHRSRLVKRDWNGIKLDFNSMLGGDACCLFKPLMKFMFLYQLEEFEWPTDQRPVRRVAKNASTTTEHDNKPPSQ